MAKRSVTIYIFFLLAVIGRMSAAELIVNKSAEVSSLTWPEVHAPEVRPWTWWWWHGNAVTKSGITANLEAFQRSGIGGVNIVSLLDVRDEQAIKLPYLSKEWIEAVAFAVREAHRLGMEVDLSPVSGWAFGGPHVTIDDACANVEVKRLTLDMVQKNGMRIANFNTDPIRPIQRRDLSAVVAQSNTGAMVNLNAHVNDEGILEWNAPDGTWVIYTAMIRPGSSRVRMPTPASDGWVVDHLSSQAVQRYFEPYTKAFSFVDNRDLPRAFNNDSWEIKLNWTRNFPAEFIKRRGYDLRQYLPAFIGEGDANTVSRVLCDYRQTVSDLMVDEFTRTFSLWASSHGRRIIGEACNEPGNELDLHALYDIPQADVGGPLTWYVKKDQITLTRAKLTTSPAHILGKPLISSETLTCFGPVLDTPMASAKDKLDADLLSGINHTMLHGISYSPAEARWPGWLFYAGFHLGDFNPMWRQGKKLCDYVTRCQSFLQRGKPDNDLLIYLPIHDYWSQRAKDRNGQLRSGPPTGVYTQDILAPTAPALWHQGYDYSLFSDRLLESIAVTDGRLVAPGGSYQALVIADCSLLPETTLKRVVQLANDGATIIFPGIVPVGVPGLHREEERRQEFYGLMKKINAAATLITNDMRESRMGKGRIIFGGTASEALAYVGVRRETLFDRGLRCIRRVDEEGTTYFIVNPNSNKRVDDWVPLNVSGNCVVIYDPMDGGVGIAKHRQSDDDNGSLQVYLQLDPRESCMVRVLNKPVTGPAWPYMNTAGGPLSIQGLWEVHFIDGGETIPHPENIAELTSWTTWSSDQAPVLRGFSGVASYAVHFSKPALVVDDWAIDLGTVLHTARVRLNGVLLCDRFTTPMRVLAGTAMKEGDNLLEIEVANTPINRAADLDMKGIIWQKTLGEDAKAYRIGDLGKYWKKKEASTWVPSSSGLLGPVQLIPMRKMNFGPE